MANTAKWLAEKAWCFASQETDWEERLCDDLQCVEREDKHYLS